MKTFALVPLLFLGWTLTNAALMRTLASAVLVPGEPVLALKGLDPIELVEGKEVGGAVGITVDHGNFRYRFASDANRELFAAEPDERGIQFDGACAKMGPPGSICSTERWLVHDGRIYVFASDICRDWFAKDPDNFGVGPDPEPAGDASARARGKELLAKVVQGLGGESVLASLRSLRIEQRLELTQNDKLHEGLRVVTLQFPGCLRRDESWDGGKPFTYLVQPEGAAQMGGGRSFRNGSVVADLQRRIALRNPLFLVQSRREPGFVAVAAGRAKVGDREVDLVDLAHDGTTARVAVDAVDGRILELTTSGRTAAGNATATYRFSDFRDVGGGLILPIREEVVIGGQIISNYEAGEPKVEPNFPVAADHFALPD